MAKIQRHYASNSGGSPHTASFDTDRDPSTATCSCRGFRSPNKCWHVKDIVAAAGLPPGGVRLDFSAPEPAPVVGATTRRIPPMLASAMTRTTLADYCNDGWRMEVKYNGHRRMIRVTGGQVDAWSRPGRSGTAHTADLPAHLHRAAALLPDCLVDGEEIPAAGDHADVRRTTTRDTNRLVLFDILEVCGQDARMLPYLERRALLVALGDGYRGIARAFGDSTQDITIANSEPVTIEAVERIRAAKDLEGCILKSVRHRYQAGKRSANWIKLKVHEGTAVLTIVGFKAGENGPYSVIELRHADGTETTVKTKNTAIRNDITRTPAKYLGARLVISHKGRRDDGTGRWENPMFDHLAGGNE